MKILYPFALAAVMAILLNSGAAFASRTPSGAHTRSQTAHDRTPTVHDHGTHSHHHG